MSQLSSAGAAKTLNLPIACFLINEGNGDVNLKNRKGKTPLELLEVIKQIDGELSNNFSQVKEFVMNLVENRNSRQAAVCRAATQMSTSDEVSDENQPDADTNDVNVRNDTKPEDNHMGECIVCNELVDDLVLFESCGHKICCENCCHRMKKCIKCNAIISAKISAKIIKGENKTIELKPKTENNVSVDRLKYLEAKIAMIEEANSCPICMERVSIGQQQHRHQDDTDLSATNSYVVFLCGHGACVKCAQTLKICHMCRKTITKKINLY